MKSIETLRDDIYDLFRKPHQADPGRIEALGQAISQMVARRLIEERGPTYLRMSNLGKGDRQLWYEINHPEYSSEELSPSTKIKFLFGDILELLLVFFAEESGHAVDNKQKQVDVNGVKGSIDATVDNVLIDCKSASQQGFKKFEKHNVPEDDPFGYMEQLSGYSEGLGGVDGAFLAIEKQSGHIVLDLHKKEELAQYRIRDRIDHVKNVVTQPDEPERCFEDIEYGKSGNRVLGTNCSYCPFKKKCWADANNGIGLRTFLYSRGPVHFTKIEKEPDVMEVTF